MVSTDDITKKDPIGKEMWLGYITVSWHALIGLLSIFGGVMSRSIAVTGFGLESMVQTAAVILMLWRYRLTPATSGMEREPPKRRLLFFPGVLFLLLALYILNESGSRLFYQEQSAASRYGLMLSIAAFIGTAVLALLKLRTARRIGSPLLLAQARENMIRLYLPLVLFLGLWLHNWYGLWWADPAAAFLMLPFIIMEGWKAIDESKGGPTRSNMKKI